MAISLIIYRFQNITSHDKLLKDKLIKALISHIDLYQICKNEILANVKNKELEIAIIEKSISHLHVTTQSRKKEIEYLRYLSSEIVPLIFPRNALKSTILTSLLQELIAYRVILPCMDIITDPDFFNYLIIVLSEENLSKYDADHEPRIILLQGLCSKYPIQKSTIGISLKEIVHNQDLLFLFMNFMKSEGVLNLIQFYMSLEDFMKLILNPDLKLPQIDILNRQCQQMYKNFFDQSSSDRIDFDANTIAQMKYISEDKPENVLKLRNTSPLYTSREHVVFLLENTFIPLFCQSGPYINWILGGRNMFTLGKDSLKPNRKSTEMLAAVSKLGHKIKGVFKGSTEGNLISSPTENSNQDPNSITDSSMEDEIGSVGSDLANDINAHQKDLSLLTVTIPKIESRVDNIGRQNFHFIIHIQKIANNEHTANDVFIAPLDSTLTDLNQNGSCGSDHSIPSLDSWVVERRYLEFYVLESKLVEFHGSFEDVQLPTKRAFSAKDWAFVNAKKSLFENYLQKLCHKSELRNSELLHSFLTSPNEFVDNTNYFLPDLSLGKMFKAPLRLLPEKGQHLEPFIQSFISSTETAKNKSKVTYYSSPDAYNYLNNGNNQNGKCENKISNNWLDNPLYERDFEGLSTSIMCDDSKLDENGYKRNKYFSMDQQHKKKRKQYAISGFYDYLIYLCFNIYHAPEWLIRLLLAFRTGIKPIFESFVATKIAHKTKVLTHPSFVNDLLKMISKTIFPTVLKEAAKSAEKDHSKKRERYIAAKTLLNKKSSFLKWVMPEKNVEGGTDLLFECFQHPILNKHLSYVILDIIISDVFPELAKDHSKN
ncbi:sorting nexin-14-like [Gordionus sp. m RMFG-2023]|uniref:sorting nexin-14-like n=1 Tax=Gordionus sp. m RMFG-2023 TaxID=3053472 RepID=UPI0031FDC7BE